MIRLRAIADRAARRYVPGSNVEDALRVATDLRQKGIATTVGFWNGDGDDPATVESESARLTRALRGQDDAEASVKATELAAGALERLAAAGVRLHCDALAPEHADAVHAAGSAVDAGVTLPGRWTRSPADAAALMTSPQRVRVVKGQWPDPVDPDRDPRSGYARVIEALAGRAALVQVATHDGPLARFAIDRLRAAGTPCELGLLYGLRCESSVNVARDAGVPVRVYVPYGTAYLPYALGAARRNPRAALRLAADLVVRPGPWEGRLAVG
jgi:proline dehydrogenase